jgi:cysteinyl-tRNA synthetase
MSHGRPPVKFEEVKAGSTLFILLLLIVCSSVLGIDFRDEMRSFIRSISAYARSYAPRFIIIPQNGQNLLTLDGTVKGKLSDNYVKSINGIGRENLFYGYERDDVKTVDSERNEMISFMDLARSAGLTVMVIDYCSSRKKVDDSYVSNSKKKYISFAANRRTLDNIPPYPEVPFQINDNAVTALYQAENFLCLINPESFTSKQVFISTLSATKYDLILIDLFFSEISLTREDVNVLRKKQGGFNRLIIAYMSIGEAENYRYYWKKEWLKSPPSFLEKANRNWPGNYKVRYWDRAWQSIIFGIDSSYLKKIIDAGFDGVYLDIVDAFEYFEAEK